MTKKPVTLNRDAISDMILQAEMRPEKRMTYRGFEIYLADGFTSKPHVTLRRFDVEESDFPFGAYTTGWFVAESEDKVLLGHITPFDSMEDPHNAGKAIRLEAAEQKAKEAVDEIWNQKALH